jgi:hypothetical protein
MSELVAIPDSALREKRRVLLALPWYRAAHPLTTVALLNLFQKDCMGVSISFGDAFIVHARNKLATKFLASKFDWVLMLDDDTVPPCGNAAWFNESTGLKLPEWAAGLNAIDRLVSHGKTLVGATYFGRSPDAPPVFAEGFQRRKELLRSGPLDQVVPTKWVGTGCLLIHRRVFEDIEKKFPHLSRAENNGTGQWFTSSEHDLRRALDEVIAGLSTGAITEAEALVALQREKQRSSVHSSLGMGEDVQLCVRATQSGHHPFVDLGLWCGHFGPACYPVK